MPVPPGEEQGLIDLGWLGRVTTVEVLLCKFCYCASKELINTTKTFPFIGLLTTFVLIAYLSSSSRTVQQIYVLHQKSLSRSDKIR